MATEKKEKLDGRALSHHDRYCSFADATNSLAQIKSADMVS